MNGTICEQTFRGEPLESGSLGFAVLSLRHVLDIQSSGDPAVAKRRD
jgi:hypothetical protein